jgi:hypothetical protein
VTVRLVAVDLTLRAMAARSVVMVCGDVVDGTSHARNEDGLRRDFCVTRNTSKTKTSPMVLELNARRIESVGLGTNSLRQQIDLVEARIMSILTGRK